MHKRVNSKILPDGDSLRTYQLSDQEREQSNSGALDILTGFQIVDDESRLIVVEGLADGAMRSLHDVISHRDTIRGKQSVVPRLVLMNSNVCRFSFVHSHGQFTTTTTGTIHETSVHGIRCGSQDDSSS